MENKQFFACRFNDGIPEERNETLVVEAPLQIKINNNPYTITMRTPGKDHLLAIGLLFTEGIITSYADISGITASSPNPEDETLVLNILVKNELITGKDLANRSIASSASCGVCGKKELCHLANPFPLNRREKALDITKISDFFDTMHSHQFNFSSTGGSHAAAIFNPDGVMLTIQEDIGRHNAVDKTIGELIIDQSIAQAEVLCVSGRISFEIVAKCAVAEIPFLAAVSAPSSFAVELCNKVGITLIGFCRGKKATVYSHPERIIQFQSTKLFQH